MGASASGPGPALQTSPGTLPADEVALSRLSARRRARQLIIATDTAGGRLASAVSAVLAGCALAAASAVVIVLVVLLSHRTGTPH